MDDQLVESLLYQEESETLDVKEAQYAFTRGTDEQKGELLKDILAFANAWRQTDAHILIGVKEVKAGRSIICGIPPQQQMLNRNLQQFINSKTNRPVAFSYEPYRYENTEIGVITIPVQERPVFSTVKFGRVEAEKVYIRRRDTTDVANPDEISRMVSSAIMNRTQPALEVHFADLDNRESLGTSFSMTSTVLDLPESRSIPLYGPPPRETFGVSFDVMDTMRNRDYYRNVATYLQQQALLAKIGLVVKNSSATMGEQVIVTLGFDAVPGLVVCDEHDAPSKPSTYNAAIPDIRRLNHTRGRFIDVNRYGNRFEVKAHFGTLQPGMTEWSDETFLMGADRPVVVEVNGIISSNNLRRPYDFSGKIEITTSGKSFDVKTIKAIAGRLSE